MGNIFLRAFPKPLWPLEIVPVILVHGVFVKTKLDKCGLLGNHKNLDNAF
jgi:hypothetical protein